VQTEPHAPHSVVVTGDPQAQPCDHQGPQWINDCGSGFDLYGAIFPFVLGRAPLSVPAGRVRPAEALHSRTFLLGQSEFLPEGVSLAGANLGETAVVYVPSGCGQAAAPACPIHVDYHGCYMADEAEQFPPVPASRAQHLQYYLQHSGQWDYAEAYQVVVINPRVGTTPRGNPLACWNMLQSQHQPQLMMVMAMLRFVDRHLSDGTLYDALWARAAEVGRHDAVADGPILTSLPHDLQKWLHPRPLLEILYDDLIHSGFGVGPMLPAIKEAIAAMKHNATAVFRL